MPKYHVVLVEPKFEGNIGATARAMKNFGISALILVNPCEMGDDCHRRAMHANDILEGAKIHAGLDAALEGLDYLVGTSGIETKSEKKHLRKNLTPREFASKMTGFEGSVGILFGREDFGLYNSELEKCDAVVTIPASETYPILNVSHAASIILYELFVNQTQKKGIRKASKFEKDRMMEHFSELLDAINYPDYKKKKTTIMFQRILGRAVLSKWEFYTLMGVFSKALKTISKD